MLGLPPPPPEGSAPLPPLLAVSGRDPCPAGGALPLRCSCREARRAPEEDPARQARLRRRPAQRPRPEPRTLGPAAPRECLPAPQAQAPLRSARPASAARPRHSRQAPEALRHWPKEEAEPRRLSCLATRSPFSGAWQALPPAALPATPGDFPKARGQELKTPPTPRRARTVVVVAWSPARCRGRVWEGCGHRLPHTQGPSRPAGAALQRAPFPSQMTPR